MQACPAECGYKGVKLEGHYQWSPHCRPAPVEPVEAGKRKRDPKAALQLFSNRVAGVMGKAMLQMHVDYYFDLTDLEHVRGLVVSCAELVTAFVEGELQANGVILDPTVFSSARAAFTSLPSTATIVARRRQLYNRAVPRHLASDKGGDKKGAVFFSAHNLVTIMLQESQAVRKMVIASSDEWKTGELYKTRPTVQSDLVHGTRFLDWHAVCGKATVGEANDLRVLLHGWTDEFTPMDGLSQRARVHKYGAFLVTPVNLPLRVRHYADHVLMLALYNSIYAKARGGLCRMLTGIGADGTQYEDGCTFAGELALGESSPTIELPDDADPTGGRITFRLRLYLLLVSLDWLAAGEFGPFAGSVSARRPCTKCHWLRVCGCAHLSRSDPRLESMEHHEECLGVAPRTHAQVMETVRELRELAKQPRVRAQRLSTATGIFSPHFASEHLLRDVVIDSTVDVMHLFGCGLTRYLFSWVTDDLIPRDFTWDQLNAANKKYRYKRGVKVATLERSKGDKRGSCSTHLNAAEMMAFAVARPPRPPPLAPPPPVRAYPLGLPSLVHHPSLMSSRTRTLAARSLWSRSSRMRRTLYGFAGWLTLLSCGFLLVTPTHGARTAHASARCIRHSSRHSVLCPNGRTRGTKSPSSTLAGTSLTPWKSLGHSVRSGACRGRRSSRFSNGCSR